VLGDERAAGEHSLPPQVFPGSLVLDVGAGGGAHDLLEWRKQLRILHYVWRFGYRAYLWSARRLNDYTISARQFEPGGIEMIDLDAALEDNAYNFGH
jgi:hypothetical protein